MRKMLIIMCLIVFVFSIAAVSAADVNQTIDDADDSLSGVDALGVSLSYDGVVGSADNGTFTDLQKKIDDCDEGSTINLEKNYVSNGNDTIIIVKSIIINGNGFTLDGNHISGILKVEDNATNVVLKNINFINGYGYDSSVSAISGNCSALNCTFINNHAHNGGGAIRFVYAVNCTFINNSASDEGGAMMGGSALNCTFINNSAIIGGAIADGSAVNSIFINNSASDSGGAMDVGSALNCTFINNSASDSGGAMDVGSALNCTFINNSANYGGAMYDGQNISDCTFINNSAGCGGAIFIGDDLNECLIENSRFLNNFLLADGESTWVKGGGAIFVFYANFNIRNSTFIGNKAANDGECGGAVLCYESVKGSMDNSIFLDNHARKGSTFYFAVDSNINVTDSIIDNPFTNNQIYVDGGSSGSYVEFTNVSYDEFKNQSFYVWENTICFKTRIAADNLEKIYGDDKRLCIYLTDINSNPLANEEVSIEINGILYTRTTDANGMASIAINLPVGEYNATFYFDGEDIKYSPCSGMSHITVNTSIYSESYMKKYCRGPEPYEARFLDKNGNYQTQGKAIFNINGVLYERNVKDGTARLNINLEPGNYTITAANPVTGEMKSSLIEVLPTIIDNHDLVKYYRNDSQYVVKLDGDLTDKKVTFNINGVFYERYANETGYVKLNINLEPGEYIITAEHNGCCVANNIRVLPVLNATDLKMSYLSGSTFNVTLLDGQGKPYAGQNIMFNVNGVFYERTTDANGIARLNINLMAGEYIITSSYNGSNIANKITISS